MTCNNSGVSACNKCGAQYPSAPADHIHKCGRCSGLCYPTPDQPIARNSSGEQAVEHLMKIRRVGTASLNEHQAAAEADQMRAAYRDIIEKVDAFRAATPPPAAYVERLEPAEDGEPVAFVDCPPGLFRWNDLLCFKSEYSSKPGQQDAYCVDSGEYFWGGASGDLEARRSLIVTPVTSALALRPAPPEPDVTEDTFAAWLQDKADSMRNHAEASFYPGAMSEYRAKECAFREVLAAHRAGKAER